MPLRLFLTLALPCLLFHASVRTAAGQTKDPIDTVLNACLNGPTGYSTVGQTECAAKAARAWESELNKIYGNLMRQLDPASQALLRTSQRQWLAFRQAERKFQAGPWTRDKGTLMGVTIALENVDVVRSRVSTLRHYAGENPK
jgi:uncharacterized protein YecT (DUF1311 family)